MVPGRIEGATHRLSPPPDAGDRVQGLAILRAGDFMISAWHPDPEEIAAIAGGAAIYLHVLGTAHPAVAMTVGPPPVATGDVKAEPTMLEIDAAAQAWARFLPAGSPAWPSGYPIASQIGVRLMIRAILVAARQALAR